MSQSLTTSLGCFVAGMRLESIPPAALGVVHTGFADCVGTLIAGSIEGAAAPLAQGAGAAARRGQPLSFWPTRARARGRLDQRHRCARARLRRCFLAWSSEHGLGSAILRRRRFWARAARRWPPPMSPATKSGRSSLPVIRINTTRKGGTRQASSGRSRPPPPAHRCAHSTPTRPRRRWRSPLHIVPDWSPTSAR